MGLENAQSVPRLTREVDQGHFDMILHVGDVAYDMYEVKQNGNPSYNNNWSYIDWLYSETDSKEMTTWI